LLLFAWAARSSDDALGQSVVMPVVVTLQGPKAVQVLVSTGSIYPCDASENKILLKAWMGAGQSVQLYSNVGCVCLQHTYDDFPGVDWSLPRTFCRRGCERRRPCTVDPNQTISIAIQSNGPS
jgi:hypothetical protein